jgi:hypothetical protein
MADNQTERQKIIYIVGLNKSGTTWLSVMLAKMKNVINVGEVWYSTHTKQEDWSHPKYTCTCGDLMSECGFWGQILEESKGIESNTELHKLVLKHFKQHFPGQALIDTAKFVDTLNTGWLAPELSDQVDIRFIQVVRDYRPWSLSRKRKYSSIGRHRLLFMHAVRWLFRNVARDRFLQRCGKPVLTVCYEKLIFDYENELKRIVEFAGLEKPEQEPAIEDLTIHIVRGNNSRMDSENYKKLRYDSRWTLDSRFLWLSIFLLPMHWYWKSVNRRNDSA